MAVNLTEGSIAFLSSGEAQSTDVNPVLQVTDIRLVQKQTQSSGDKERYRLLLSDGSYLQQGMLGTQLNDLVRSERLQKGSVVKLNEFVCNVVRERMIIIIIDLEVILEKCDPIGEPKHYLLKTGGETTSARSSTPVQPSTNQPGTATGNPQSFQGGSLAGSVPRPNSSVGTPVHTPNLEHSAGSHSYGNSFVNNPDLGRYNSTHAPSAYPRTEPGAGISPAPASGYMRPVQPAYNQPPPMYMNRGPIAKNEAPARITPIAALNLYQSRWTIKARVTAKGELRHYHNPKGEGKVFSFDLLDSDGGEIQVTCFNTVADQFYNQIEAGKVYVISKGTLKPAQKAFNHLRNDHEIHLESTSTVQPCFDTDTSIPQQQFHFRSISDIEGMENNSVLDVIGVVSTISPSSTIMRKNGTEIQKRILHLKDMSGRSVELTLWGNFCNAEGQTLQHMCDSGLSPVLAVKSARVNEFNGKSVGTISTSQLFIEPDFPEARKLKAWFENEGGNTPSISISRDTMTTARTDARKTVSQIKDERLGTSEKPDWITISATVWYMKLDNLMYTACPIMIGERQCQKKVTNNGDGKWRCDRCDQTIDQCDYRYIIQLQIQDHTGMTWVTAFQQIGEELLGISAKDLYHMKYEEQDDDKFTEIVRSILFNKYIFKLKVKEETFGDETRVKSTVVKAEKVDFSSDTRFLLDLVDKLKKEDPSSIAPKPEISISSSGTYNTQFGNSRFREPAPAVVNYVGGTTSVGQQTAVPASQVGQYGNQYGGSRLPMTGSSVLSCNSCGGAGHSSTNCPSVANAQGYSYGGRSSSSVPSGGSSGAVSGECYKCHQFGHWARDCPGMTNVPPAYTTPGRYGNVSKQHVGF